MNYKSVNGNSKQLLEVCKESLGISVRLGVLKERLDVVGQLAEWIRQLVEHKHSLALEWGIILLIAGEIALTAVKILSDQ